ncbi:MAG: Trp family transcriptional regulator [Patescibacteria group bacterium]
MRTSTRPVSSSLKNQIDKTFIQLISDLKDTKEIEIFLADFFNQSELETFTKRLAVAYWLHKNRSYNNIKENLKVSSATIATMQESINKQGIRLALKMVEAEEWANQWSEKIRNIVKK